MLSGMLASAFAVVLVAGAARVAHAQRSAALPVVLRIRPPVGDTLRMQMRQDFRVTGDRGESAAGTVSVWTHAVPLRRRGLETELVSVTDSVVITPPTAAILPPLQAVKRALQGQTVRMWIGTDGGLRLVGRATAARQAAVVTMASVLPVTPVSPGARWARAVTVPLTTTGRSTARAHVRFRFDSLGPTDSVAYLSMHGDFAHDHAHDHPGVVPHAVGRSTGTIDGAMQIDLRLGWITDSRTTITLSSVLEHPGQPPTRVHMRVTQWLRALTGG